MTDTVHDEAFWLEEYSPPKLTSNKAKKGDADFKSPLPTPGHGLPKTPKPKKAKQGPTGRKTAHKGAGPGGGQFVSNDGTTDTGAEQAAVKTALSPADQSGMKASIMAFQKKHGLKVDGVVGRQTALALGGRYTEARSTAPGRMSKRESGLLIARHQPAARRARVRARRQQRAAGGVVAEEDRHPAQLLEEAVGFFDPKKHPKDTLGKWAKKLFPGGNSSHGLIPEYDPKGLKFGGSAGGTTGARTAKHKDGSTWLVKTYGGNEDRVATELLSNAAYRHMGAQVPRAGRIKLLNGKQALSYPFLEGKPQPMVFQGRRDNRSAELGKHFMMDALLANWDVAGLEDDNILWNKAGEPFRVDQGGTLEFRAQGSKKFYGPVPTEVDSMLSAKGQASRSMVVTEQGLRQQARDIGQHMGPGVIDSLVDGAGFKDQKMRERVRTHLKARVAWMRQFGAGEVGWPVQEGWVEAAVLQEAVAAIDFHWDPHQHPRNQHGKFVKTIFGLGTASSGAKKVNLDAKTTVSKDKDGTFRVVRSGQIIKGFTNAGDAARAALDRSVKGKDDGSVGGMQSYKDFNAYLESRGLGDVQKQTSPNEPILFGGEALDVSAGIAAHADLSQRLAAMREQGKSDKYIARAVPTLEARHKELSAKLKGKGLSVPKAPAAVPAGVKVGDKITKAQFAPGMHLKSPSGQTWVVDANGSGVTSLAGSTSGVGVKHPLSSLNGETKWEVVPKIQTAKIMDPVPAGGVPTPSVADAPGLKTYGHNVVAGMYFKHAGSDTTWYVKSVSPGGSVAVNKPPNVQQMSNDAHYTPETVKELIGDGSWVRHTATGGPVADMHAFKTAQGEDDDYPGDQKFGAGDQVSTASGKVGTVVKAVPVSSGEQQYAVTVTNDFGIKQDLHYKESDLFAHHGDKATAPTPPVKKVGKNAKQANTLGEGGQPAMLKDLHLVPGDKVQHKPGGYVYTFQGPSTFGSGHIYVHEPTGKKKQWAGFSKPLNVIKADQSPLVLKEPGMAADVPPAPAPEASLPSIATLKMAMSSPSGNHPLLSQLHDGDVIQTPDGALAVMKPSEPAYEGYVAAYNIQTGVKIEVPKGKPPVGFNQVEATKKAAAQHLANAKAGTSVSAASPSTGQTYKAPAKLQTGPPDSFLAANAWGNAKSFIPSAGSGSNLTSEEAAAIRSYTGSGYSSINSALRDSKSVKDLAVAKKAAAIKKALAKNVVKKDVWIGRKTDNQEWKNNATAGTVIADNGVISTSINPNSWSGAISLNILVRQGHNALYVNPISNHPGEDEVLLPPGSHFHVLKREESGGHLTLYVEML